MSADTKMKNIKVLDCTLRDGGSINNCEFGYSNILNILQGLNDSKIDIIETGFLDENVIISENKMIFSDISAIRNLSGKIKNRTSKIAVMINYGKFNLSKLPEAEKTPIDIIRLMFKKNNAKEAITAAYIIKEKGYNISLNPVSLTTYNKEDIKTLTDLANNLNPHIVYMVDTYGLMNKKETLEYFKTFNKNLNPDIIIGYHSHNNLQLSFPNSIEIINGSENRKIVIDCSLYGMGKRAGNTNTELITWYLNNNFNKKYNINILSQLIETTIKPLHEKYKWGYSLLHYIAAVNNCHSDYALFLYDKNMPVSDIDIFLKRIQDNDKLTFSKSCIETLYNQYKNQKQHDKI